MQDNDPIWFYVENDERRGPVSEQELARLIQAGRVMPYTLVWKSGMQDWVQANQISSLFANMPPPIAVHRHAGSMPGGYTPSMTGGGGRNPNTFTGAISTCLGKYAVFSGRASRSEYWFFHLFLFLVAFALLLVFAILGVSKENVDVMMGILQIAVMLPSLAVGARRLHDIGKSGWWQLLMITVIGVIPLIIMFCLKGDQATNEYGPSPLRS